MPEQPGEVGRHSGVDMSEADFLSECTEFLTLAALEMTARGLTRAKFVRAAGQFGSETQDWKQRLFGSDGALAQHVRRCVPMRCSGNHWSFMHKTVQESPGGIKRLDSAEVVECLFKLEKRSSTALLSNAVFRDHSPTRI